MQKPGRSIAVFVVLSCGLSWVGGAASHMLFGGLAPRTLWFSYVLNIPATWGPALAALAVARWYSDGPAPRALLGKLRPRRADMAWVVVLPPTALALTLACFALAGAPVRV